MPSTCCSAMWNAPIGFASSEASAIRASSSASSAGSTTLLSGPYVSRHCLIVSSRSLVIVVIC